MLGTKKKKKPRQNQSVALATQLALEGFKREHINKGDGTKQSNEHKSWVSLEPKKKKGN